MPDNELDELADNFFCHLHDHNHNEENVCATHNHRNSNTDEEDLTNILNPLRDTKKLRKSILVNSNLYLLNDNHIQNSSLKMEDDNKIKCSDCLFNIGYRGKAQIKFD